MRTLRTVPVFLLAAAAVVPATTTAQPTPVAAKRSCTTTFASASVYRRARVVVVRRVSCTTALKVAKAYDQKGRTARGWACGLAHGEGTRLFSCGKGLTRGSLTNARYAFVAYGAGGRD